MKKFPAAALTAALIALTPAANAAPDLSSPETPVAGATVLDDSAPATHLVHRKNGTVSGRLTLIESGDTDAALAEPLYESKPSEMSAEQWYSINPRVGFSYATQAKAYFNGLEFREKLEKMRSGGGSVLYRGVHYSQTNVDEFEAVVTGPDSNWWLFGLPRWYDANPSNNDFLAANTDWKKGVNADSQTLDPETEYDKSLGFNANYFDSLAEQDAFIDENGLLLNQRPFPTHSMDKYDDYQVLQAGLFLYSDGTTHAPTSGDWAASWHALKSVDFDANAGYGPYRQ